jgi:hypothetical protein
MRSVASRSRGKLAQALRDDFIFEDYLSNGVTIFKGIRFKPVDQPVQGESDETRHEDYPF